MLIASIKEINWLVFIQTKPLQKQEMQSIANEIGFSGSCFIDPMKKDDGSYDIRIFTPAVIVKVVVSKKPDNVFTIFPLA